METVTVLVYVLIAMLFAPVVWLLWFGLDEMVRPARRKAAR